MSSVAQEDALKDAAMARVRSFIDAFNAGDATRLGALFADDADFVNIFGMWMRGRPALTAGHAEAFTGVLSASLLEVADHQVKLLRPDLALCHVRWKRDASPQSSLPPAQGVLSLLAEHRPAGWTFLSGHNTQTATPPGHR